MQLLNESMERAITDYLIKYFVDKEFKNRKERGFNMDEMELIRSYWRMTNKDQDDSIYTDEEIMWGGLW